MSFIAIFAVFILWLVYHGKISALEERVHHLEQKPTQTQSVRTPTHAIPVAEEQVYTKPRKIATQANNYPYQPLEPAPNAFFEWLKEDFMVKLGGFLLLIAMGWFVSYAFANNWIGPMGRIMLGLLLGAVIMVVGVWRIRRFNSQGAIFTVLGGVIVIMTLYAAREMYGFFTPASALGLMFFTTAFMAFVSVRYQNRSLAFVALIIGSISPLFTNSPEPDMVSLFSYLLVIALGTLWVVWMTGWTQLIFTSLLITYLFSLPSLFGFADDSTAVLLFTFVFVSLYFVANLVSLVRRNEESTAHIQAHVATAIGTVIFLVSWIEAIVGDEYKSLLYTAWALVFAVGTYVVFVSTNNRTAFYLYGAVAVGLIGVATAAELQGPALTIAYLLEIALLIIAVRKIGGSDSTVNIVAYLLLIPGLLALPSIASWKWNDGIFHQDFAVIALTIIVFGAVGMLVGYAREQVSDRSRLTGRVLLTMSGFFAFCLVWLTNHALFADDSATTISLVIYTIVGIGMFVVGKTHRKQYVKTVGALLIGLVIGRLLLIDVWDMDLVGRIITFLIIGCLLISTAFLRKPDAIETDEK